MHRIAITMAILITLPTFAAERQTVFIDGQAIEIPLPANQPWRVIDVDGKEVAQGNSNPARINNIGIGYFELISGDAKPLPFAVVRAKSAPTPRTSPIAIDVAMAWFYKGPQREQAAKICAAANINWVRDRLSWGEVEKSRGTFAADTRYDQSAAIQSAAGLRILQVNHSSPSWAGAENHKRFPVDLRDAHRFHREIASRWRGKVEAFEPWNEADIEPFGGHTGAEIASFQKASYLGIKSGNPDAIACMAVFAIQRPATLQDFAANQAAAYFDTTNLHHYVALDKLPAWYASFRAISAGKPLWVSECSMPVKWTGDEKAKELTPEAAREQARRVAKTFATSLHEGSRATFFFLLPHYSEGQTQFGLLHADLSPRPGYTALAAVGHFLSDAKPLGKLPSLHAYVFRARPGNGEQRDVLVAWGESPFKLPDGAIEVADHFGRGKVLPHPDKLSPDPIFAVYPSGTFASAKLDPAPNMPPIVNATPCPVIMQMIATSQQTSTDHSAYRLAADQPDWPINLYNFSDKPVTGRLTVSAPEGWKVSTDPQITITPNDRRKIPLRLQPASFPRWSPGRITLTGDFAEAGQSILSALFLPQPPPLEPHIGTPLAKSGDASAWRTEISNGSTLKLTQLADARIRVEAAFAPGDKWAYPRLGLSKEDAPPPGTTELAVPFKLIEGAATFRAMFVEQNGACYVVDAINPPIAGKQTTLEFLISQAKFGQGWSHPDDNDKLDLDKITAIKIGCNTRDTKVTYELGPARWVK